MDVEKGVFYDSPLGVPHWGLISPILSNKYLHELDLCVEDWIKGNSVEFSKGISKVISKIVKYSSKLTELALKYKENKAP